MPGILILLLIMVTYFNYEIFLTDVNSNSLVQVTDDPAIDQYLAWNPEKSWTAFSSDGASVPGTSIFSLFNSLISLNSSYSGTSTRQLMEEPNPTSPLTLTR